jgi:hypothetical protein
MLLEKDGSMHFMESEQAGDSYDSDANEILYVESEVGQDESNSLT